MPISINTTSREVRVSTADLDALRRGLSLTCLTVRCTARAIVFEPLSPVDAGDVARLDGAAHRSRAFTASAS